MTEKYFMLVDLHIHTDASDGTWGPLDLLSKIKEAGIGLFAVADHDSIGNVERLEGLVKGGGLKFIPSVEISSTFNGTFFHILGYGIDIHSKLISDLLKKNIDLFKNFQDEVVKGLFFSMSEFKSYSYDRSRGGFKLLNFMVDKGVCKGIGDFVKLVFKEKRFVSPEYGPIEDAIKIINESGGFSVLAHPGSTLTSDGLDFDDLNEFVSCGLNGIECYSQYHDKAMTKKFVDFCRERGLLITGGSDCHGDFVSERKLGVPKVELKDLNLGELTKYL